MNKIKMGKKGYVFVATALIASMVVAVSITGKMNSSASSNNYTTAKERLLAKRDAVEEKIHCNEDRNEDELVRAIVKLQEDSVVEAKTESNTGYTAQIKSQENKIIKKQDSLIKAAEKITGNEVENQSAYLVNTFSIDATRKQMKQLAQIKGVEDVYEATTFKPLMTNAVKEGTAYNVWNDEKYGYTGEGVVVAVIDTGVNYKHQDMVLDEGVKTKFTKEEWKEKIKLLGYGEYFTEKVPFGYNYYDSEDGEHGHMVSGIIAGNNKNICGVARNAQLLRLKINDAKGNGTSDGFLKAIEDAVKLGADVVNMSFGKDNAVVSDEDLWQVAVNNASKEGVICCAGAGNAGTSSGGMDATNKLNMKDTATIGRPAIAESCIAVACAENVEDKSDITMTRFTSWGPTNELGIKPDISAPGGNITASSDGVDNYNTASGTSLASPFVAGSEALLIGAVRAKRLSLEGEELTTYLKNSLLNTADAIVDKKTGNYFSVRQQGSGMVDVYGAVDNDVLVTYNGKAKVELGEITEDREIALTFTNYGKGDRSYTTNDAKIYTDYTVNASDSADGMTEEYGIKPVEGAVITFSADKIVVPAGKKVTIKGMVKLTNDYEKDSYVEAFIKFTGDDAQDIGLPVLGFYGDFDKEPIIDEPIYNNEKSFLSSKNQGGMSLTSLVEIKDGVTYSTLGNEQIRKQIENETLKPLDDEDDYEEEEIPEIKLNEECNINIVNYNTYRIKYEAQSDGYITYNIKSNDFMDIITEESRGDEYISGDRETAACTLAKEINVKKGFTYEFKITPIEGRINSKEKSKERTDRIFNCKFCLHESDGSNCFKLTTAVNGDKVAFSPNGDGKRDMVGPDITLLRNAKEISVKVLDANKNVVRELGTEYDKGRTPYLNLTKWVSARGIKIEGSENCVGWDGLIGDIKAPEGQYYIQLEAKRLTNSLPQVVTMPVKLDVSEPMINNLEVKKENDNTVVYFKPEDNTSIADRYYIDVETEYNGTIETKTIYMYYLKTEMDEQGRYVVNLGQLDEKSKATIMVEDVAGNTQFKTIE